MVMCFVPLCKHYSEQRTCKFLTFPVNAEERKKWINLIRRGDREPSKYSLVCSCHFKDGLRKNGPTIFEYNVKRRLEFTSPEKRERVSNQKQRSLPEAASEQREPMPGSCEQEPVPGTSQIQASSVQTTTGVVFEAENYFLKQEVATLSKRLQHLTVSFSYDHIKDNDASVLMYTGLPTAAIFELLFNTMDKFKLNYYSQWNVEKISKIDQCLLTLIKLRLNLPHEDLAIRFNCSRATVTNIFMTWLSALHNVLLKQLMATIPSRKKNQSCLPSSFLPFPNCRIILDCTELYTAVPKNLEKQRLTYSSYKHRNTWKILVGVAPNGVVTYISELYPGSLSDKKIVNNCGILNQMCAGDMILADKGFLIKDILPEGVTLNIPPFLSTPQFTERQVCETRTIAKARIHVERAICRIKCYNILDRIPQFLIVHASIIFQVCAALTNWQYPLIKEVEEYYN